jgi:hypothetical protein
MGFYYTEPKAGNLWCSRSTAQAADRQGHQPGQHPRLHVEGRRARRVLAAACCPVTAMEMPEREPIKKQ